MCVESQVHHEYQQQFHSVGKVFSSFPDHEPPYMIDMYPLFRCWNNSGRVAPSRYSFGPVALAASRPPGNRRPDPHGHNRVRHRLRERGGGVPRHLLPAVRERGAGRRREPRHRAWLLRGGGPARGLRLSLGESGNSAVRGTAVAEV